MNLLGVEMKRALRRRVVHVLVVLALVACVFAGVVAFVGSAGKELSELHRNGDMHPAVLADWWAPDVSDGVLLLSSFFLLLGGLFGGASVAGAEWRAGTISTTLTWEPRRVRFHAARTAACGILAFVISVALQAVFLGSFVPSVLTNGTTAGVDLYWWTSLGLAIVRTSLLTAVAAMLGVALATIGRNTAFALIVAFGWMVVVENLVRGLRPGWAQYLWGENIGTVMPWAQMEGVDFARSPMVALVTLGLYSAILTAVATATFRHRDVGGAS